MVVNTSALVVVDTSAVVVNDEVVMLEMCPASFELCKRLSSQVEATSVVVALGLLEAAIDTVVGVAKPKTSCCAQVHALLGPQMFQLYHRIKS